mmetsp:Transcript_136680/g.380904  ORF Transcript_136680/g.380904 Transcript_136680/m.380904 type:complete len:201 (-) Transcript_136680:399-1001(-)
MATLQQQEPADCDSPENQNYQKHQSIEAVRRRGIVRTRLTSEFEKQPHQSTQTSQTQGAGQCNTSAYEKHKSLQQVSDRKLVRRSLSEMNSGQPAYSVQETLRSPVENIRIKHPIDCQDARETVASEVLAPPRDAAATTKDSAPLQLPCSIKEADESTSLGKPVKMLAPPRSCFSGCLVWLCPQSQSALDDTSPNRMYGA